MAMELKTADFGDNEMIPVKYTCEGGDQFPPLTVTGVPTEAKTLVLVMDDPDIPEEVKEAMGISVFDHLVSYNIPADTETITGDVFDASDKGLNSAGTTDYKGPCPPSQYEPATHRYVFRVYALPEKLDFGETPTLKEVEEMAKDKMLDSARLTGIYKKQDA